MTHECGPNCRHTSSCAVHNEPAYPAGPCDCGLLLTQSPAYKGSVESFTWNQNGKKS